MIFLKAFIVGGIICALVQIVIDKTKVTPARIMVSLVCIGVVLGAIGIYEPLTKWAGWRNSAFAWLWQQSLEGNERSHR